MSRPLTETTRTSWIVANSFYISNVVGWLVIIYFFIVAATQECSHNYYTAIRWFILIFFGILGYRNFKGRRFFAAVVYAILTVLFNPFLKFHFESGIWKILDWVVVAVISTNILLISKEIYYEFTISGAQRWLMETLTDIDKAKWCYHLAAYDLKKNDSLSKDEKDELYKIIHSRYMKLSDQEKEKDYDKYLLADIAYNPESPFSKYTPNDLNI